MAQPGTSSASSANAPGQIGSGVQSASAVSTRPSTVSVSASQSAAVSAQVQTPDPLFAFSVNRSFDVSMQLGGSTTLAIILILALGVLARLFWKYLNRTRDFELDEAEFGFGQQKIKLKANDDDRQIAYKIWVELSTRKIGLAIDLEQDVVTEVYDSWHTFFSVTRELIKDVPVRKYRRDSTAKIIRLSIEVLNEGLRPHLTRWQARFRRWYERRAAHADFGDNSPQEIQADFPAFDELKSDMMLVNERLIAYRTRMHELISK